MPNLGSQVLNGANQIIDTWFKVPDMWYQVLVDLSLH